MLNTKLTISQKLGIIQKKFMNPKTNKIRQKKIPEDAQCFETDLTQVFDSCAIFSF